VPYDIIFPERLPWPLASYVRMCVCVCVWWFLVDCQTFWCSFTSHLWCDANICHLFPVLRNIHRICLLKAEVFLALKIHIVVFWVFSLLVHTSIFGGRNNCFRVKLYQTTRGAVVQKAILLKFLFSIIDTHMYIRVYCQLTDVGIFCLGNYPLN
jgi:hypothetical protein